MSSDSFRNIINKMCFEIIHLMYMYEKNLVLLTYDGWHTIKSNQTKPNYGSNWSMWKLFVFDRNTWNHRTVCVQMIIIVVIIIIR